MDKNDRTSYAYFVTQLALGERPPLPLGERDGRPGAAPGGLCLTIEDVRAMAQLFAGALKNNDEMCISPERVAYLAEAFKAMHEVVTLAGDTQSSAHRN